MTYDYQVGKMRIERNEQKKNKSWVDCGRYKVEDKSSDRENIFPFYFICFLWFSTQKFLYNFFFSVWNDKGG
jgi:hypothetical protein